MKSGKTFSKRLRIGLLAAMAITLAALVAVYAVYRRSSDEGETLVRNMPSGSSLAIENLRHTAAKEGAVEWTLNAARATMAGNRKSAVLKEVSVVFFAKDGSRIRLTADAGRLDLRSNNLAVSGNVVIRQDDYRMDTERLEYRQSEGLLVAQTPVRITGTRISLEAESATFDLETWKLLFEGNVYGTITEHLSL